MKEIPESSDSEIMDRFNNIIRKVIKNVVKIIIILLTIILIYTLAEFVILTFKAIIVFSEAFNISINPYNREKLFITQVQGFISAVLLLTILIELLQALTEYIKRGTTNYVEIITEIALIAIVRHLLVLNIEHIQPGILAGLSSLIFVLGLFFLIVSGKLKLTGRKDSVKYFQKKTNI